jgi:hypothetical protein
MRCFTIAVVLLLFVTTASAQIPPASYIPPAPILNPSSPFVVPQAPPLFRSRPRLVFIQDRISRAQIKWSIHHGVFFTLGISDGIIMPAASAEQEAGRLQGGRSTVYLAWERASWPRPRVKAVRTRLRSRRVLIEHAALLANSDADPRSVLDRTFKH